MTETMKNFRQGGMEVSGQNPEKAKPDTVRMQSSA